MITFKGKGGSGIGTPKAGPGHAMIEQNGDLWLSIDLGGSYRWVPLLGDGILRIIDGRDEVYGHPVDVEIREL